MGLQNVVWDMDGTLLDTTKVVPEAFARAVAALEGPDVEIDEVTAAYGRGTSEGILSFLVGRELTAVECEAYYRELDHGEVAPYPGVALTIAALRERGKSVAAFTGASTRAAQILLGAAGLEADIVIGGDQVDRPKPAADGMLLTATRLSVAPEDLALVGDSPWTSRPPRQQAVRARPQPGATCTIRPSPPTSP